MAGAKKMQDLMAKFRKGEADFGEFSVEALKDYGPGIDGLPKADVLRFSFTSGASVIVRPSGTEPKLKIYASVAGKTREDSEMQMAKLEEVLKASIG